PIGCHGDDPLCSFGAGNCIIQAIDVQYVAIRVSKIAAVPAERPRRRRGVREPGPMPPRTVDNDGSRLFAPVACLRAAAARPGRHWTSHAPIESWHYAAAAST